MGMILINCGLELFQSLLKTSYDEKMRISVLLIMFQILKNHEIPDKFKKKLRLDDCCEEYFAIDLETSNFDHIRSGKRTFLHILQLATEIQLATKHFENQSPPLIISVKYIKVYLIALSFPSVVDSNVLLFALTTLNWLISAETAEIIRKIDCWQTYFIKIAMVVERLEGGSGKLSNALLSCFSKIIISCLYEKNGWKEIELITIFAWKSSLPSIFVSHILSHVLPRIISIVKAGEMKKNSVFFVF